MMQVEQKITSLKAKSDELPHDGESERAIVGAIIVTPHLLSTVPDVKPELFHNAMYRAMFQAMRELDAEGTEINQFTVANRARVFASSVDAIAVNDAARGIPARHSLKSHVEILREKAMRRWTIRYANELISRAYANDESAREMLAWADTKLGAANERAEIDRGRGAVQLSDCLVSQLERWESFHMNRIVTVPTGFDDIDSQLWGGGFARGQFVVVAARPASGKTSFAIDMTANAAKVGSRVLFVSLEMPREVVIDRMFSFEADVKRSWIAPGLYADSFHKLVSAADRVSELQIFIDDRSRDLGAINRTIRNFERQGVRFDLIIVDYLQLMKSSVRGSRNDQVGENSHGLQELAKETNAAVVALAALSREHEGAGREPDLRDLRECGDIEYDARTALFLYRADDTDMNATSFTVNIKCAKQGEGRRFKTSMLFNGEYMTFRTF